MTQQAKKTKKQRSADRMARDGRPLSFQVRAHVHPETLEPLVRFKVGDRLDVSISPAMMREVAKMIQDACLMAELIAGHAQLLKRDPEITLAEFGPYADDPAGSPPGTEYTQAEFHASIRRGSIAFQEMLIETLSLGASRPDHGIPPGMQDEIVAAMHKMHEQMQAAADGGARPEEPDPGA